jgi:hypothetical protein
VKVYRRITHTAAVYVNQPAVALQNTEKSAVIGSHHSSIKTFTPFRSLSFAFFSTHFLSVITELDRMFAQQQHT